MKQEARSNLFRNNRPLGTSSTSKAVAAFFRVHETIEAEGRSPTIGEDRVLRVAWRMLRAEPGFSVAALETLEFGKRPSRSPATGSFAPLPMAQGAKTLPSLRVVLGGAGPPRHQRRSAQKAGDAVDEFGG